MDNAKKAVELASLLERIVWVQENGGLRYFLLKEPLSKLDHAFQSIESSQIRIKRLLGVLQNTQLAQILKEIDKAEYEMAYSPDPPGFLLDLSKDKSNEFDITLKSLLHDIIITVKALAIDLKLDPDDKLDHLTYASVYWGKVDSEGLGVLKKRAEFLIDQTSEQFCNLERREKKPETKEAVVSKPVTGRGKAIQSEEEIAPGLYQEMLLSKLERLLKDGDSSDPRFLLSVSDLWGSLAFDEYDRAVIRNERPKRNEEYFEDENREFQARFQPAYDQAYKTLCLACEMRAIDASPLVRFWHYLSNALFSLSIEEKNQIIESFEKTKISLDCLLIKLRAESKKKSVKDKFDSETQTDSSRLDQHRAELELEPDQLRIRIDDEWVLTMPMSKAQMRKISGIESPKKFNTWAEHIGIRQAGNRQLWRLRLDKLDAPTRNKFEQYQE